LIFVGGLGWGCCCGASCKVVVACNRAIVIDIVRSNAFVVIFLLIFLLNLIMVEVGWRDDGANLVGLGAIPGMGSWLKNDYRNVSKSSIFCDFYHGFAGVSRQWLRYVCGGLWLVLRLSWGVGVGASGAVGAGLSWDGFVVTVAINCLDAMTL